MCRFRELIIGDRDDDEYRVVGGGETGGFDVREFWRGVRYEGLLPPTVRLDVEGTPCDFVANPISWPICSSRMADVIERWAANDVQFFDAPLYDSRSKKPIRGYKIVNITRRIECLDLTKTTVAYSKKTKGRLSFVGNPMFIREIAVPPSVHIFRVSEWSSTKIVSDELAEDLVKNKFTGFAFLPCKSS
jgi:hypothetical protein